MTGKIRLDLKILKQEETEVTEGSLNAARCEQPDNFGKQHRSTDQIPISIRVRNERTIRVPLVLGEENMRRLFIARFAKFVMLVGSLLATRADVSAQEAATGSGAGKNREKIGEVLGKPVYRDQICPREDLGEQLDLLFHPPLKLKYFRAHQAEFQPTAAEFAAFLEYSKRQPSQAERNARDLRQKLEEIETQLESDNLTERKRDRLEDDKQLLEMKLKECPPEPRKSLEETLFSADERAELLRDKRALEQDLRDPKLSDARRGELVAALDDVKFAESPERWMAGAFISSWKLQRHLYDKFGGGRVLGGFEAFDATRKWLEYEEQSGHFKITDPKLRTEFYRYWTQPRNFMLTADSEVFLLTTDAEIREQFLEPAWARKGH
jgi:hypothetical protein